MLKMRQKELNTKTETEAIAKACYDEESGSEDEAEKDDVVDDAIIQQTVLQNKGKMRTSVSAEAFGQFHKKEPFKPRVIEKKQESKDKIRSKLEEAFMFKLLEDDEKEIVINAMEESRFQPGDQVIKQGDEGDCLYLVEEGELDCFKKFANEEQEKHLKTQGPGEAFGELCLLQNAPRAASITAKTEALCWALDRGTFTNIVKTSASRKRDQYESFLGKVELLESMEA